MYLTGTFQGTFESQWSMKIDQKDWEAYVAENPEFDNDDAWNHFKNLCYYDECDDSADLEQTMISLEYHGLEVEIN
jgi:hypothetical protein